MAGAFAGRDSQKLNWRNQADKIVVPCMRSSPRFECVVAFCRVASQIYSIHWTPTRVERKYRASPPVLPAKASAGDVASDLRQSLPFELSRATVRLLTTRCRTP